MQEYLLVLGYAALPAIGNFAGALLAELTRLRPALLSFALHFATGIILAVVGIELVGTALQTEKPWAIALAFVLGGGFAVLLDKSIDLMRSRFGNSSSGSSPWMIYAGVSIDLFSDGIMIGTGATVAGSLALLLAMGQVSADVPEGFATIATFKRENIPRMKRMLLAASFAIPVFIGATMGYWMMRDADMLYKFALLSFTGGILLTTAVEEMMAEAHAESEEEESGWQRIGLVTGFALFMLILAYLDD